MRKFSFEAKVGLLVVVTLLGIGIIATTLEPMRFGAKPSGNHYFLEFDNVGGLEKDAPVRVAGVTVGKVLNVGVKGRRALVEIALFEPLKVYENARARIETMGLMGEKYVELDPGAPPAQPLKPESTIVATTTPASIDQVMTSMKELVEKFNQAMMTPDGRNRLVLIMERITSLTESIDRAVNDVSVVIEENRESIGEILKNILAISTLLKEELPEVVDNVNTLATQLSEMAVENREDIRETVLNLKKAVEKAPQIVERMDRLALNLEKLLNEQSVKDIKETIENVKDTSAELKELLAGVNQGKGTMGKLFNDDRLYQNLTKTTETLGKVAEKVEKTRTYIGFSGDVNTRTGDSRGVFTFKIVPSQDHFYLLEVVGDSQGKVSTKDYYITHNGNTERRKEIETDYRVEFTLQYARVFEDRWFHPGGRFVLRGGLKESTGGIGLDYVYNDRLTIFSDLWDPGREDEDGDDISPHLRVGLKYYVGKNWFIYGGGDELLYDRWRGFFLGAGVLFGDEDLKYLLGSVPGGIR